MKKLLGLVLGLLFSALPLVASAHVGYVEPDVPLDFTFNQNWPFIFKVFSNTNNLLLMAVTLIAVLLVWKLVNKSKWLVSKCENVVRRSRDYTEFVPLIVRLSLGVLLIGAGFSNALLSPLLEALPGLANIQIVAGFFLILGFLTAPIALLVVGLYISATFLSPYMLGGMEILALSLSLLAINSSRPGLDEILGIRWGIPKINWQKWTPLLLRIGVGGSMIFLAIYEKFLNPVVSLLVVNDYHLRKFIPVSGNMWVVGAGLVELAVGLAILLGFKLRTFSVIALLVLSTTFFFFTEAIYPHVTLFGALIVLFILGEGAWSIEKNAKRLY